MTQRRNVDRERIESFLKELGRRFRQPGRVYLVGGTTLVFEGLRAESLDIDLVWSVESKDSGRFVQVMRELKDELGLNVEEASPSDFIPLPAGHADRCEYVGRYGSLDVFHFDPYSTALSKIARGTDEDLADVMKLLDEGRILWEKLEQRFNEILPQYAAKSLRQNPELFQSNFQALQQMLSQ